MKRLVGKDIEQIRLNSFQGILTFDHPEGDSTSFCFVEAACRQSWLADITGVALLLEGRRVEGVFEIRIETDRPEDERDGKAWGRQAGWVLKTFLGDAAILYQNFGAGSTGVLSVEDHPEEAPEGWHFIKADHACGY